MSNYHLDVDDSIDLYYYCKCQVKNVEKRQF